MPKGGFACQNAAQSPAMRLLHTSDWHLGHTLRDFTRAAEHEAFLAWLVGQCEAQRVDALLVAGDVFDTSNPPASALEQLYRLFGQLARRCPELDVVVVGGNHDSAPRLDAPRALLEGTRIRVVGGLPPRDGGALDASRLVVPITSSSGARAWVCAVPFLRTTDLPTLTDGAGDALIEGVRRVYAEVLAEARQRRSEGEAIVAMGHAYMVGGLLSELSERKVLGGNQHALPVDIFPDDVAYVALGHLHRAQVVGGDSRVRYSGSPLPLSTTEAAYPHQVRLVVLEGPRLLSSEAVPVPRHADVIRIPAGDSGSLEPSAIGDACASLPEATSLPFDRWPFVEVHVRLARPDPSLVERIHQALDGKAARLVRVVRDSAGTGASLGEAVAVESLARLTPEDVFRKRYAQEHEGEPPAPLLEAFHEAIDAAMQEGAS